MAVTTIARSGLSPNDSPYQLDPDQTLKASKALLTHIAIETAKLRETTSKRSLIAPEESDDEEGASDGVQPVWLNLATKQHIVDKNRLKPTKIAVPHSLNTSTILNICLITTDPQRPVKNAIADPLFPAALSTKITKVISLQKLTARYKSFESRRQLCSEHDIFLADERIILRLPKLLGKVFYQGTTKRPIPISIAPRKSNEEKATKKKPSKKEEREAAVASPSVIAAEIERSVNCVPVSLKPGTNVAVKIGLESFTPQQLVENIDAVVPKLVEKHVVKGWRNIRSINIKSPTSLAVPIWLSDNLWADEENILDGDAEVVESETAAAESKKRKRNPATAKGPQTGQRKKSKAETERKDGEDRKNRLAAQKAKAFSSE